MTDVAAQTSGSHDNKRDVLTNLQGHPVFDNHQTLTEAELTRAANLRKNGSRDITGPTLTHCVPNQIVVV